MALCVCWVVAAIATNKMSPDIILPFKNLYMEPTAIISLSESTNGPPDPSIILPSDEKKTSQYEITKIKLKVW